MASSHGVGATGVEINSFWVGPGIGMLRLLSEVRSELSGG